MTMHTLDQKLQQRIREERESDDRRDCMTVIGACMAHLETLPFQWQQRAIGSLALLFGVGSMGADEHVLREAAGDLVDRE